MQNESRLDDLLTQRIAELEAELVAARKILASGKANNWAVRSGSDEGGFRLLPWVGEAEHFLSIDAARGAK